LYQQFTSHPGNLTALLRNQATGHRSGLIIALKSLTATSLPPPLWWPYPQQPQRAAAVIDSRPAVFAVVILAGVTVALLAAVFPLRSRALARLATVSLLTSGAALVSFSHIPMLGDYRDRLSYLMMVMVAAGLLDWITIGLALALAGQQMVSRLRAKADLAELPGGHHRPARAGTRWAGPSAGAAAVVLIELAAVPGLLQPPPSYPGDPRRAELVSAAARLIEMRLPPQPMTESVVAASIRDERRVSVGLKWALMGDGYRLGRAELPPGTLITKVTVFLQDNRITAIVAVAHQRAAASPA
jgi:hypothetical protein